MSEIMTAEYSAYKKYSYSIFFVDLMCFLDPDQQKKTLSKMLERHC